MKQNLFVLSWREIARSASFGKSIATKILLGFLALYFFAIFLMMGISISKIIAEKFPGEDPVYIFNRFLLAYFAIDLLIRQLMQALPTVQIKPLLVNNVRRTRIVRYLLGRSVVNFFNVLPFFMLVPVAFTMVGPEKGTIEAIVWLLTMFLIVFSNHFLSIWLKWKFNESGYGFYVFIAVICGLMAINYFEIVNFQELFAGFMAIIFENPLLSLGLLALPAVFYVLNFRFLKQNLYLNLLESGKKDERVRDFSWLNNLGDYGKFIALDLRLIWRNKRPRSQVMMTIIFLLYGLLIYKQDGNREVPDFMFLIGGFIMISLFTISYGQFFPSWHSRYFPLLMAQNFRMKQFLNSFYILNVVVCTMFYLFTLPYAFMHTKIIYTHFVILLYTLGVNVYLIFLFGLFSKKGVQLEGSSMFNYQGVGATQWLMSFPLIFGPLLLYYLFKIMTNPTVAYGIIGGIGLIGILLQPLLINYFAKAYLNKKHQLIKNYKNT